MVPAHARRFLNLALVGELALGVVAVVWSWLRTGEPLPQTGALDWDTLVTAVLATLPLALGVGLLTSPAGQAVPAFRRLSETVDRVVGPAIRDLDLAGLAALSAAAGLAEELLFRGVIQEVWGLGPAVFLFGLAHALTPTYFLLAAGMGWYLGWLYQDTGNLSVPILVHALYDLWALWLIRRQLRVTANLERARQITEQGQILRRAMAERRAALKAREAQAASEEDSGQDEGTGTTVDAVVPDGAAAPDDGVVPDDAAVPDRAPETEGAPEVERHDTTAGDPAGPETGGGRAEPRPPARPRDPAGRD